MRSADVPSFSDAGVAAHRSPRPAREPVARSRQHPSSPGARPRAGRPSGHVPRRAPHGRAASSFTTPTPCQLPPLLEQPLAWPRTLAGPARQRPAIAVFEQVKVTRRTRAATAVAADAGEGLRGGAATKFRCARSAAVEGDLRTKPQGVRVSTDQLHRQHAVASSTSARCESAHRLQILGVVVPRPTGLPPGRRRGTRPARARSPGPPTWVWPRCTGTRAPPGRTSRTCCWTASGDVLHFIGRGDLTPPGTRACWP